MHTQMAPGLTGVGTRQTSQLLDQREHPKWRACSFFTKAAAFLNVAQSGLLHVRQLEEGFGTQLLIPDRSVVSATASGAKRLERARTILKEIRLTEVELINSAAAPAGEVTMGIRPEPLAS